MPDYVVKFEKTPDYKRFIASGVLTKINSNLITIDFYEETSSSLTQIVIDEQGKSSSTFEDWDIKNYVHASAIVAVETIPSIIEQLQKIYDKATSEGE
jgi:hypothetical protein